MDNTNQQVPPVQNIEQSQSAPLSNPPKHSKIFIIVLVIFLITLAIGIYVLGTRKNQTVIQNNQISISPTISQPSPTIDLNLESTGSAATANWKTYRNTKYGFQIKYPDKAEVDEKDDGVDIIVVPGVAYSVGSGSLFRVMILGNPQNLSLEEIHKDYLYYACNTEYGGSCERVVVNGYDSLKASGFVTVSENDAYYIQKGKIVFRLTWHYRGSDKKQIKLGDQILSTFQFSN